MHVQACRPAGGALRADLDAQRAQRAQQVQTGGGARPHAQCGVEPPTCILPWLKKAPPSSGAEPPVNRTFWKVTKKPGRKPELSAWKMRPAGRECR